MTYTLKDIQHLSVMADLANAKPIAKPQVDIRKLLASDKPKELTVQEKIVILCSKLRAEGFEKQAAALEHKFLDYKSANIHLYRVIDEDGEDLINAAHPDGEVKVEESTGDLGNVETILTEHKKLVDIVNKEPKAKHAANHADAIKFITAQDTNELGQVNLLEMSKKFKYISDYLTTHFLTDVPEGETLQPSDRSFYGTLGLWKDLTNQIATELNHDKVVPLVQGIQLVKNRLFNASFANAKQYAQKINSVGDIDKLVSWILSWAEDNNPIKKANKLMNYVDDCKQLLKQAGPGLIPFVLWIWSKTNRFNHGVKKNTEMLISEINDLFTKEEITRNADGTKKLNDVKTKLDKLLEYTVRYESIETSPTAKDLAFINAYDNYLRGVRSDMVNLNNMMTRLRRQDEESFQSSALRVFVASDYEDVQKAVAGLNKAMGDMMTAIATAKSDATKAGVAAPTQSTDEQILSGNVPSSDAENGIKQLRSWLDLLPEPKKQKVAPWINAQIKDFQDNANNPEKVKQLLKENEEFKIAWKL